MNKNFKNTIKVDIENLFYDEKHHSLTDWDFCQALKNLIEKWERRIDEEVFSESEKFINM